MAEKMDRATLELIMRGMTTRDRGLQCRIVTRYLAPDFSFTHVLGDCKGREAVYGVYRAAVSGLDYDLLLEDMIYDEPGCKAACVVDLNIKLAPFYWRRYHLPTVVVLQWRRDDDGLYRLTQQTDHHSFFSFMVVLGWPMSALAERVTRPLTGKLLTLSGLGVDALQDAAAAAITAACGWLGLGSARGLPPPVVHVMARALPPGLVQAIGLQPLPSASAKRNFDRTL